MQTSTPTHSLSFTRVLNITPEQAYSAWITPELIYRWFCPKPWRVTEARTDARTGGASYFLMEGPNGEKVPNRGVYLELVPNRKIVFTDAYVQAWIPSEKPFMTGVIEFAPLDDGRKTQYTCTVYHWNEADKHHHEQMGFYQGWGIATDQLEALFATE